MGTDLQVSAQQAIEKSTCSPGVEHSRVVVWVQAGQLAMAAEAQDRLGWTPLHAAAKGGHWAALSAFVSGLSHSTFCQYVSLKSVRPGDAAQGVLLSKTEGIFRMCYFAYNDFKSNPGTLCVAQNFYSRRLTVICLLHARERHSTKALQASIKQIADGSHKLQTPGFEPGSSSVLSSRSNQLSYTRNLDATVIIQKPIVTVYLVCFLGFGHGPFSDTYRIVLFT